VYKTTRTKLVIEEPLPQVFMMSISWFGKDLTYLETFNFAVSIPRVLKIEDIFADNGEGQLQFQKYRLKAMVCFLGAHYMVFIRNDLDDGQSSEWRLYDDGNNPILRKSWAEVLIQIISFQIQPTLLLYEKMGTRESQDAYLNFMELNDVYLQAQNLENTMNEIYGIQSRNADEVASMLASPEEGTALQNSSKVSNDYSSNEAVQRMSELR
jgi:hypothetical protein